MNSQQVLNYKGYQVKKHIYLHDEEIGFELEIAKDCVIVGGANNYEEAKEKIDLMEEK